MLRMEKTPLFDAMSKVRQDGALREEWQKLSGDANNKNSGNSSSDSKKSPLQEQQMKLSQMQASMKANKSQKIGAVNSVQSVDALSAIEGIDTDIGISSATGYQNGGKFDIKQDILSFIRPTALNADNLKKETLGETGITICTKLELSGASENLISRAKALFQEEATVKSVTEAYRNSLIFS